MCVCVCVSLHLALPIFSKEISSPKRKVIIVEKQKTKKLILSLGVLKAYLEFQEPGLLSFKILSPKEPKSYTS